MCVLFCYVVFCWQVWWGRRDPSHNLDFLGCSRETIDHSLKNTEELAKNIYVGANIRPASAESDLYLLTLPHLAPAVDAYIGGLPYTDNPDKLDDLRAFLMDIFEEFGLDSDSLELVPGKGFARMKV